ncbi:MAG: tetratricopeptide repeat protein [Betaproteobacteria bacterium]|nr:tetratricopeptide repeat protein [Betaproteobacteria bacterium]
MSATDTAQTLVAAGDPQAALHRLQQEVRTKSGDPKLRVFLFQLLCVLGQWQRALTQLQTCGELDAGALAMVATYREALQCEAVREAVFSGKTTPHVFGRPQAWVPLLAEALQADARGDSAGASRLRSEALDQAPATAGSLNGKPFDWIADADSRLGPVLEAVINGRYCWVPFDTLTRVTVEPPEDLRDLVWAPAQLGFTNGGETVALIPTRYAGSAGSGDAALQMARKTEWEPIGTDHFRGLGQRILTSSGPELGLLEVREILLSPPGDTLTDAEDASGA